MKPYLRADRISVKIQVVITELLRKKLQNPKVEMATISGVRLTSDLRIAYVYITVFGGKKKIAETMKGFAESKRFIKKSIAPQLGLKFMPDLKFIHDDSFDKAARMDALIKSAADSDLKPLEESGESSPEGPVDPADPEGL